MKRERIIEFVGATEEEVAWLRLMVRRLAVQLVDRWRMRRDDDASVDLLVVADNGEDGLPRADSDRRVRLIDPAFGPKGMEVLAWPPPAERLVQMLNLAGVAPAAAPAPPAPEPDAPAAATSAIRYDVYDDLFDGEPASQWKSGDHLLGADADWVPPPLPGADLIDEAEAFFRRDDRVELTHALKSIKLPTDLEIEATEGKTEHGIARKDRRGQIDPKLAGTLHTLTHEEAEAKHPLAGYLGGRLLPGPSRIEVGEVLLVLDPRNRQYYTRGVLSTLEDLCRMPLRRGNWRTLTTKDFEAVRQKLPARPYAVLSWLCAYLDADCGADLDEHTRYRSLQALELGLEYTQAERVAAMLAGGCTLGEAAAGARVRLSEARRVAGALDAIGALLPD